MLGVKKECKQGEQRVALTPNGAKHLLDVFPNLWVLVEDDAGFASGFSNDDYRAISERVLISNSTERNMLFAGSDILLGVKEILPEEYHFLRYTKPGSIIACFWHVMDPEAKKIIAEQKLNPIWLESMPGVLKAMSAITGRMSVDIACHYLRKNDLNNKFVGRGMMPENATLTIIGAAGNLGQAAYAAARHRFARIITLETVWNLLPLDRTQQASVADSLATIEDNKASAIAKKVRKALDELPSAIAELNAAISDASQKAREESTTITEKVNKKISLYHISCEVPPMREATKENILRSILESDAVISGVHIPGKENPKPITKDMIVAWGKAKPHAIFVDPAIDQGGSSETSTPTTHQNPVYLSEDILHYCVPNMPGAIPLTSTPALEQALLPNLIELIKTAKRDGMGY